MWTRDSEMHTQSFALVQQLRDSTVPPTSHGNTRRQFGPFLQKYVISTPAIGRTAQQERNGTYNLDSFLRAKILRKNLWILGVVCTEGQKKKKNLWNGMVCVTVLITQIKLKNALKSNQSRTHSLASSLLWDFFFFSVSLCSQHQAA